MSGQPLYEIRFAKTVYKDFRGIPKSEVSRILQKIQQLASEPRPIGSEKLSGAELYRIRQGNYRIIYSINDQVVMVTVVKVGHRKHVYK